MSKSSTHLSDAEDAFSTITLKSADGVPVFGASREQESVKDDSGHVHGDDGKFSSGGGGGAAKKGDSKPGKKAKPTYHHAAIDLTKKARQGRIEAFEQAKSHAGQAMDDFAGVASLLHSEFNNASWPEDDEDDHHMAMVDLETAVSNVQSDPRPEDVKDLIAAANAYAEHDPKQGAKFQKIADKLKSHMKDYIAHRKVMRDIKQARC